MLRLSWLISLGISLIGFLIMGNLFTVEPGDPSARGNFGFVGIILILPFLCLSLFTTFRYFLAAAKNAATRSMKGVWILSGVLLIAVFCYLTIDYKNQFLSAGNFYAGLGSTMFDLPKLNEHTYSIYFNFYTFALIHTISGMIGIVIGVLKGSKPDDSIEKNY